MRKNVAIAHKKTASKAKGVEPKPYLTKRLLVSAAKRGIRKAAEETMQVMGYTVIAQNGWIVKKYADGRIEEIEPLNP